MMGITCKIGLHVASDGQIWNDGHFFATCRRCGCALIRRPGRRWRQVPRGYAIVWRPAGDGDARWNGVSDVGESALEPENPPYRALGEPMTTDLAWRALGIGRDSIDDTSPEDGEPLRGLPKSADFAPIALLRH